MLLHSGPQGDHRTGFLRTALGSGDKFCHQQDHAVILRSQWWPYNKRPRLPRWGNLRNSDSGFWHQYCCWLWSLSDLSYPEEGGKKGFSKLPPALTPHDSIVCAVEGFYFLHSSFFKLWKLLLLCSVEHQDSLRVLSLRLHHSFPRRALRQKPETVPR